jgi:hypothetical protein
MFARAVASCAAPAWFSTTPQPFQQTLLFDGTVQSESVLQLKSTWACDSAATVAFLASIVRCAQLVCALDPETPPDATEPPAPLPPVPMEPPAPRAPPVVGAEPSTALRPVSVPEEHPVRAPRIPRVTTTRLRDSMINPSAVSSGTQSTCPLDSADLCAGFDSPAAARVAQCVPRSRFGTAASRARPSRCSPPTWGRATAFVSFFNLMALLLGAISGDCCPRQSIQDRPGSIRWVRRYRGDRAGSAIPRVHGGGPHEESHGTEASWGRRGYAVERDAKAS